MGDPAVFFPRNMAATPRSRLTRLRRGVVSATIRVQIGQKFPRSVRPKWGGIGRAGQPAIGDAAATGGMRGQRTTIFYDDETELGITFYLRRQPAHG